MFVHLLLPSRLPWRKMAINATNVLFHMPCGIESCTTDYAAKDWKLLKFKNGLQWFRCYVEQASYTVLTKNQVVSNLLSKTQISRREALWIEVFANFTMSEASLGTGRMNVLGDALSQIQSVQTNITSALHLTEAAGKGLQEMIGSCTDDQRFGKICNILDDMEDLSNTEKKRVRILKPDFSRYGWRLFYKEELCTLRKAVRKVLE